jgi:parallel beta-helix repeat protein
VSIGIEFTPPGVYRAIVDDVRIMAPTVAGVLVDSANNFAMRRVQISNTGVGADGIRVNNGAPAIGRIEACQLSGGGGRGISVYGGAGLAVVDNVVAAFTGEGIYLEGCDACLVKENTVTQAGGQGGIYVSFSRGVTLTKNVVARNKFHGIHVASTSTDARVEDNLSQNNGSAATPGDGILAAGLGGTVVGNTTNGNFGIGLHFASTAFNWTYGRNTARRNIGLGGAPCAGAPPLFFPNSCDDNNGGNTSYGDNLIPGPPLF